MEEILKVNKLSVEYPEFTLHPLLWKKVKFYLLLGNQEVERLL